MLHFSMLKLGIIEYTKLSRSCVYILVCKRKVFLSILMPSVRFVHSSQFVDHCVT